MTSFREAVERRDIGAIESLLADDVVFRSPVVFKPYSGRAITAAILRAVIQVFDDFHYVRDVRDPEGVNHVLVFEATVDGLSITGCDILKYDAEGRIVDFMVMTRPMKATESLAARMSERFEQIQADAIAAASS